MVAGVGLLAVDGIQELLATERCEHAVPHEAVFEVVARYLLVGRHLVDDVEDGRGRVRGVELYVLAATLARHVLVPWSHAVAQRHRYQPLLAAFPSNGPWTDLSV